MITQQELRSLLDYDPETGIFLWRVSRPPRGKAGGVAGYDNGSGYIKISIGGKRYFAHRLAFIWMTGRAPAEVDHANGCGTDNRWRNLRAADRYQNTMNSSRGAGSVRRRAWKSGDRWQARHGGKTLGTFASKEEAEAVVAQHIAGSAGDFLVSLRPADVRPAAPARPRHKRPKKLYEGKTISQWARETGIPQPTLHWRVTKGGLGIREAIAKSRQG